MNAVNVGESRVDLRGGARVDSGDIIYPFNSAVPTANALPRFSYSRRQPLSLVNPVCVGWTSCHLHTKVFKPQDSFESKEKEERAFREAS